MSGSEGLDLPGLLPEPKRFLIHAENIKKYFEESRALGRPVRVPPPTPLDDGEHYRWIAIYDQGVTGVSLPPHYPKVMRCIVGSEAVEICGKLVPAPQDSKCGDQILEIDERMALRQRVPEVERKGPPLSVAERHKRIRQVTRRRLSGERARERAEAFKQFVPAVAFWLKDARALKILDEWFGVGCEEGSPYERRLVWLKSPSFGTAWVWCKATSVAQSNEVSTRM